MIERPLVRMKRYAAQIKHRQDVGVANLVLKREAQNIEGMERRKGFQAVEREISPAQFAFEIDPRRKGPFAGPLRIAVHDRVENLQPMVAHSKRIRVGKAKRQLAANLRMILDNAIEFAAKILRR